MNVRLSTYPQLRQLCWNRPADAVVDGETALALYERNWRFVDQDAIIPREQKLLDRLVAEYGNGHFFGRLSAKPQGADLFQRKHHNDILNALRCLDGDLLLDAECYFGGGTAIVLNLGEYRESVDIDFLCASKEGYRKLRQALWGTSDITGLLLPDAELQTLRDVRVDQYGIRTLIDAADVSIKFEIVREARIQLAGEMDDRLGVPVLTRSCMYAEKLLANADRWADKAVLNRDILDLSMMIARWGPIPGEAWDIAEGAYGDTARKAYDKAITRIRDTVWLNKCMADMDMEPDLEGEILALHGGPLDEDA